MLKTEFVKAFYIWFDDLFTFCFPNFRLLFIVFATIHLPLCLPTTLLSFHFPLLLCVDSLKWLRSEQLCPFTSSAMWALNASTTSLSLGIYSFTFWSQELDHGVCASVICLRKVKCSPRTSLPWPSQVDGWGLGLST